MNDQVAVAGVGTTHYLRDARRTPAALALQASVNAIRDAGLSWSDIDGVCGSNVLPHVIQEALRIPALHWWAMPPPPFGLPVVSAAAAIAAGLCEAVLVYQGRTTHPAKSRAAAADPMRRRTYSEPVAGFSTAPGSASNPEYDCLSGATAYAAWAYRYLKKYGVDREVFGLLAVNDRANAGRNDHAVMRDPITMDDYLRARMIRNPFGVLDMEVPVDAGDAIILTRADRAKDLRHPPVLVHAATFGQTGRPREDQAEDFEATGQSVVASVLRDRSDVPATSADVLLLYDGFTAIAVNWIESLGFCGRGEALDFMRAHWDRADGCIKVNGRIPLNPHGGSLSEGGTQGAGHVREAVQQLRGEAGDRQVGNARVALVTTGGMFFNSAGIVFRKA